MRELREVVLQARLALGRRALPAVAPPVFELDRARGVVAQIEPAKPRPEPSADLGGGRRLVARAVLLGEDGAKVEVGVEHRASLEREEDVQRRRP